MHTCLVSAYHRFQFSFHLLDPTIIELADKLELRFEVESEHTEVATTSILSEDCHIHVDLCM